MSSVRPEVIPGHDTSNDAAVTQAELFQSRALAEVSRTFALTIPELPAPLRHAVGNAYLLCRIADTIEDEVALDTATKLDFHNRFIQVLAGQESAPAFAAQLTPLLQHSATAAELELVANTGAVMAVYASLNAGQREAIRRCVAVMCAGMPEFEGQASRAGLPDLQALDHYCYYVAGVVGQMLTELFCDHVPQLRPARSQLLRLSVCFGQGLQMTNILKDIHEDHARGVCWLPRDLFARAGFDLERLATASNDPARAAGLNELIGVAHGHLRYALDYTLLIPSEEAGIRRFCLWAVGLAVLTLRNIHARPDFASGDQVKVSRRAVQVTVLTTGLTVRDDERLRHLFRFLAGKLPVLCPPLPPVVDGIGPPWSNPAPVVAASPITSGSKLAELPVARREPRHNTLADSIQRAGQALLADQRADGHWRYAVESDCTVPAEYILMMHFMDEIDPDLQAKIANYLRANQAENGGWPLYHGGDFDISCSVKAYYALKLAGDDPASAPMTRARKAILAHGGAARANVFTRIALAQFGQIPWRGVPFIPVEVMLLPRASPFHLSKVSYWSRAVMVPLMVLCSLKVSARNPQGVNIRELFTRAPEAERDYCPTRSVANRFFKALDGFGRSLEPLIPGWARRRAFAAAESWMVARLNGDGGLGAIFPAMVNAYQALAALGYPDDHPARRSARKAIDELLVIEGDQAYCQPCNSPVWDTALACHALQAAFGNNAEPVRQGLDWLVDRQLLDAPGDWRDEHPQLEGGGWPFQFQNDYYPDLDDTGVVAWAMHNTGDRARYGESVRRAANWLVGMQSRNGGFAAFDSDNDHRYLNEIPFADHGALLDPPTSDVTARVVTLLGHLRRAGDARAQAAAIAYLQAEQEENGAWFGRWGTNYIYGTWAVLTALAAAGEDMSSAYVRKALTWLEGHQRANGAWGEDNGSYWEPPRGRPDTATAFQTAWAMLGLMAAGEVDTPALRRGADYLIAHQGHDGFWHDPDHTAPGFPRVFFLKYHGYNRYFPLWALAQHRNLAHGSQT